MNPFSCLLSCRALEPASRGWESNPRVIFVIISPLASLWQTSAEMSLAYVLLPIPTSSPTIYTQRSLSENTHERLMSPASPRSYSAMSWPQISYDADADMSCSSDADTASVMSFEPFSGISASSATDMQDHASISSGASIFSMSSSIRAQSFKHEYGRGLNNYSDVYQLPADDEELDRLSQ